MLSHDLTKLLFGGIALVIGVVGFIRGELLLNADAGKKGFSLNGWPARTLAAVLVLVGIAILFVN